MSDHSSIFLIHMLFSLLAMLCLIMCSLYAIVAFFHDQLLRKTPSSTWLSYFPAQEQLELCLFRWMRYGFFALTIALLSGIHGFSGYPAPYSLQKTLFGAMSWLIFGSVLLGRTWRGLRGTNALRFTLFGLLLLCVTYIITLVFAYVR